MTREGIPAAPAPAARLVPIALGDPLPARCPGCDGPLVAARFRFPGARVVAETSCPACDRQFLADLPSGFGLFGDLLYEPAQARLTGTTGFDFWRSWATRVMTTKTPDPVTVDIRVNRRPQAPVLLNCLDPVYGHGLLTLLNAANPSAGADLIPIVPQYLAWLLPRDIAGAIVVDWRRSMHHVWNAGLDTAIQAALADWPEARIAPALPVPRSDQIDISKFTGVAPFDRDAWPDPETGKPVQICLSWREDRLWGGSLADQAEQVAQLHTHLLAAFPGLRFVVAGVAGAVPEIRTGPELMVFERPGPEAEARLAALYAGSHVALGIHGSNMLLPSALAGGAIELVPRGRWHNAWTASLFRPGQSPAQTVFFHRFLSAGSSPAELADAAQAMLRYAPTLSRLAALETSAMPDSSDMTETATRAIPC